MISGDICKDVHAALGAGEICLETDAGARVVTHCLYPSFQPVIVFVSKLGDGYRVSDGGGALRSAWNHGREEGLTDRLLAKEATRYHLKVSAGALIAEAPSIEWLKAAILATANGSAAAAHAVIERIAAAAERNLKDQIFSTLASLVREEDIGSDYPVIGTSGDTRSFDYGVRIASDNLLVVSAIAPHHSSVYAKYVAFGDTKGLGPGLSRFAVYNRPLASGDAALMLQVTDELVPLKSLNSRARKALPTIVTAVH